jgi:serine protease
MNAATVAALNDARRLRLPYVPHQVVVKFRDGVARGAQQRALTALRSRPSVDSLAWSGPLAVVTDPGQPNASILAQQLRSQPEVEYAEPNYIYTTSLTPNDPGYSLRQWNFEVLGMPRAWDINPGATSGVIVAILDTGVTTTNTVRTFKTWNGSAIVDVHVPFAVNPDLPATRLVSPFDFSFIEGATVFDTHGHGTHVSSTVGEETHNALMTAGIAYNTRIMPVKVCTTYWEMQFSMSADGLPGFTPPSQEGICLNAHIAAGIRYAADNGARIINISLGGPAASAALDSALRYAVSKGVFVAIAAGNDFEEGNPTTYPAKYGEAIDGVMAVGAVGRTLRRSYYSTTGSYVEIAAPGGDARADPVSGYVWQSTIRKTDVDPTSVVFPRFDRYTEVGFQGTSMASPHVAGVAALVASQLGPRAAPALIEEILEATARPCDAASCDLAAPVTGAIGRNDTFGAGLVQPRAALFGRGLRR